MSQEADYTFDPVEVDPAGSRKVMLDLFGKCANYRQPNEPYGTTEYVRPDPATGFAYECTIAGTTGTRHPVWPKVIGQTVTDGSVTWTCRAASTNGLNAITSPSAVSDPTGITISDVSVEEAHKILATYTPPASSEGQGYDAVFTFTLNGVTRVARQRVEIRKQ